MNERLRLALNQADLDIDDVVRATGVSHRTVQRWIAGRVPYPRYRRAVARLVDADEADLWPSAASPRSGTSASEIVNVYSQRSYVPADLWRRLVERGQAQIDLLGVALYYLFDDPGFIELLLGADCNLRIVLADPGSEMVAARDEELGLEGRLAGRIGASLRNIRNLNVRRFDGRGFELRLHTTPMYCSLLRVDDEMLVTPHVYRRSGRLDTPILHLRHRERSGIFDSYDKHFEDVFYAAVPPLQLEWLEDATEARADVSS